MKTTIELPDQVFRKAKAAAAEQGQSLKDYFTGALEDRLRRAVGDSGAKPWAKAFGGLRDLRRESRRIEKIVAAEFETVDEQEWR